MHARSRPLHARSSFGSAGPFTLGASAEGETDDVNADLLEDKDRSHTVRTAPALRVVLGEDDVLLREGIARILTDAGLEVVARCGDADALLRRTLAHRPDEHGRRGARRSGRVPAEGRAPRSRPAAPDRERGG